MTKANILRACVISGGITFGSGVIWTAITASMAIPELAQPIAYTTTGATLWFVAWKMGKKP